MPFYFENVYIPATFWRHLETYTNTYYRTAMGPGGPAWRDVCNVIGRGILVSIGNWLGFASNFQINIDGGGFTAYNNIGIESSIEILKGFATSCRVQVRQDAARGCDGVVTLLEE